MLEEYLEFLKGRIESDLASFADPGGVAVQRSGRRFDAVWKTRGESREARLTASQDRGITVNADGRVEPYRVFLAGTQMADLRHMAQMIRQAGDRGIFVPTRARLSDMGALPRPATELLTDLVEHPGTEVTQVVMVTGEAGAGKTRVLQTLVQRQAAAYLKGLTDKLLLYVNAQGRALDRRSVREVAEYILDDSKMPEPTRQIVVERMPTLAFLAPSEKHASIMFEHEVFFFHFLTHAMVNQFVLGTDMRVILSRSALPEFVAERFAFELGQRGRLASLDGLQDVLDRLSDAGHTEWRRTTQVRENAGLIVMALLREFTHTHGPGRDITGCTISNVVFPGSDLRGVVLRDCTLVSVSIRRTSLETTKFVECNVRDVLLMEPRVKVGSTRLELNGLRVPSEVIGVQVLSDEGVATIYAPERVARILGARGAPLEPQYGDSERDVPDELLELLQKLMRAYERANPVCDGDQHLCRSCSETLVGRHCGDFSSNTAS